MARTSQQMMEEKRTIDVNVVDNYSFEDYVFNANFDSGNLGKVELVRISQDPNIGDNVIYAEFNVWTTPDCYGTPNESPNRTWFFFSIKGGQPNRSVKINVKNLNRQAKLFNQGMQPVMRIGMTGKWERIKDKPIYGMENDNFCMTFMHRPLQIPHVEHYYAFTYPFTYTECQQMLERFDQKFIKPTNELNYIIQRLLNPTQVININKTSDPIIIEGTTAKDETVNSSSQSSPDISTSSSTTPTDPDPLSVYEKLTNKELQNEIYYHRELLISSLEDRRVDLITITSFHNIQEKREERLSHLFPDNKERCHTFNDKKIIFLSSRVHPGETPASFVLNGFLNMLLDKKSVIASTLRQLYVFKIVPILNPDGVFRGHYRTDTLGQNLNRMYINPKLEIHPSIYAVKKLIKFYHFGFDANEEDNNNSPDDVNYIKNDSSSSSISIDNSTVPKFELTIQKDNLNNEQTNALDSKTSTDSYKDCTSSEGEGELGTRVNNNDNNNVVDEKQQIFIEKLIPELKTIAHEPPITTTTTTITNTTSIIPTTPPLPTTTTTISTTKIPSLTHQTITKRSSELKIKRSIAKTVLSSINNSTTTTKNSARTAEQKSKDLCQIQQRSGINKKLPQKRDLKIGSSKNLSISSGNKSNNKKNFLSSFNNVGSNLSSRGAPMNLVDDKSNMFLYIDFHGHASKKGVFMYGNHFSNSLEAVECMLLPRLMSINCHHFHYDACNFSERNMYRREKRDGLSKEGSGRVAVYKMTGLIKSYTLESNYNTGKCVNVLPGRGKDHSVKVMNIVPPKYTPAIYEEVGRALGPSILDLTNSNCLSRIHNSDFRTLQGLRMTLRNEIERNISNRAVSSSHTTAKILSAHENVKRNKRHLHSASSSLPSNEVAKENKAAYTERSWESDTATSNTAVAGVSGGNNSKILSSATAITAQSKFQLQHHHQHQQLKSTRNIKKSSHKIRSTIFFSRRDSCIVKKKSPKILCEAKSILSSSISSNKTKEQQIQQHQQQQLHQQQFHVPTKKAKVSSMQRDTSSSNNSCKNNAQNNSILITTTTTTAPSKTLGLKNNSTTSSILMHKQLSPIPPPPQPPPLPSALLFSAKILTCDGGSAITTTSSSNNNNKKQHNYLNISSDDSPSNNNSPPPHPSGEKPKLIYVDIGTTTDDIFYQCLSSESDYEESQPLKPCNSVCGINSLSKDLNNSTSSIITSLPTTTTTTIGATTTNSSDPTSTNIITPAIIDNMAIQQPCCSRMVLQKQSTSQLPQLMLTTKSCCNVMQKYSCSHESNSNFKYFINNDEQFSSSSNNNNSSMVHDISSNNNANLKQQIQHQSAFGGSEKAKLLRKKRNVRHDTTIILKRKKSKFRSSLH